jgi:hypothetical protein
MKKRKFDDGGYTEEMTPQDVEDAKNRRKAGRAFDEAMPEPDTTFGKLKNAKKGGMSGSLAGIPDRRPPGRYDSVRSKGFEEGIDAEKSAAMKQGLSGVGQMAKQAAIAGLGGPVGALMADTHEGIRGGKKTIDAYEKFKEASGKKDAADREMASQMRRETRGVEFKQGGKVSSASRRADGIATKGKTKGRFV